MFVTLINRSELLVAYLDFADWIFGVVLKIIHKLHCDIILYQQGSEVLFSLEVKKMNAYGICAT